MAFINTNNNTKVALEEITIGVKAREEFLKKHKGEDVEIIGYEKRRLPRATQFKKAILDAPFSMDFMAQAHSFQVKGADGEVSITDKTGPTTNAGEALTLIMLNADKDQLREAIVTAIKGYSEAKDSVPGYNNRKNVKYKSLIKRERVTLDGVEVILKYVDKEDLPKIKENMRNCDLDNYDNLLRIAADLNDILRLYQETIIDSAKTGAFLSLDLLVKGIDIMLHLKYDYKIEKEKDVDKETGVPVYKVTPFREEGREGVDYIKTFFSLLQDDLIEIGAEGITTLLNAPLALTSKEIQDCETARETFHKEYDALFNIKQLYIVATRNYAKSFALENRDKEDFKREAEEKVSTAKLIFDKTCKMLAQGARFILRNNTIEEKINLMTAVSWSTARDKQLNEYVTNKFVINLMQEEMIIHTTGCNYVPTSYKIIANKGLENGRYVYIENNKEIRTGTLIENKGVYSGEGQVTDVEEIRRTRTVEVNGEKVEKEVVIYRGGRIVTPTRIEIPTYNENERIIFVDSKEALKISMGDSISIAKKRTGVRDNNGKLIMRKKDGREVPNMETIVKCNDSRIGTLYYNFDLEDHLHGAVGNVVDFISTAQETLGKNGEVKLRYKSIIKIDLKITKEELEKKVDATVENEGKTYFEPEQDRFSEVTSFFDEASNTQVDFNGLRKRRQEEAARKAAEEAASGVVIDLDAKDIQVAEETTTKKKDVVIDLDAAEEVQADLYAEGTKAKTQELSDDDEFNLDDFENLGDDSIESNDEEDDEEWDEDDFEDEE